MRRKLNSHLGGKNRPLSDDEIKYYFRVGISNLAMDPDDQTWGEMAAAVRNCEVSPFEFESSAGNIPNAWCQWFTWALGADRKSAEVIWDIVHQYSGEGTAIDPLANRSRNYRSSGTEFPTAERFAQALMNIDARDSSAFDDLEGLEEDTGIYHDSVGGWAVWFDCLEMEDKKRAWSYVSWAEDDLESSRSFRKSGRGLNSSRRRRARSSRRAKLSSSRMVPQLVEMTEYIRSGVRFAIDRLIEDAPYNLGIPEEQLDPDTVHMIDSLTEDFAYDVASYWYMSGNSFNSSRSRRRMNASVDDQEDEWYESEQEFTSKGTAVNAKSGKLPLLFRLVESKIGWKSGTLNLDYGGGTEQAAALADEYFEDKGVTNLIYDKYNQTTAHNNEVRKMIRENGGADTATLSNVLNVIKEEQERLNVLRNIHRLLKGSGSLYIYCYEGTKQNQEGGARSTKKDQWQNFRSNDSYIPEIEEVFGEGNVQFVGSKSNGFIVARK